MYWKGLWLKKKKKIGYVAEGSVTLIGKPVSKKAKLIIIIIINIIIIIIITAIGLLSGGSGYVTCKQNMKLVTTKFKSGGNHFSICF